MNSRMPVNLVLLQMENMFIIVKTFIRADFFNTTKILMLRSMLSNVLTEQPVKQMLLLAVQVVHADHKFRKMEKCWLL